MKILKRVGLIMMSSSMIVGCGSTTNKDKIQIGIVQIATHDALDMARAGFVDALKEAGYIDGENISIDYKNAAGDGGVMSTITRQFSHDNKDIVFAIATPSALAMVEATDTIPVIFTAVTDPVQTKIVASLDKPNTNASGTHDAVDIHKQFNLMKSIMPTIKTVGVLYNTSELNSKIQVDDIKANAAAHGLTIVEKGVTNSSEIATVTKGMMGEVDAIYVPTDNLVAAAIPTITQVTDASKVPVFASEAGQIEGGAIATDSIDYYELGKQSGRMAIRVLKGEDISTMPVESSSNSKLIINKGVADKLGIVIPQAILEKAEVVE